MLCPQSAHTCISVSQGTLCYMAPMMIGEATHPVCLSPKDSGALIRVNNLVVICLHNVWMTDCAANCCFQHGLAAFGHGQVAGDHVCIALSLPCSMGRLRINIHCRAGASVLSTLARNQA